ncbi:hypothetical protein AVEN_123713-1 [Araneus ventricosus]|uniref:Uncharacterized protein n=1 Tax=Araneus ventricosus TaxID=182803 RepID=A0A4Y2T4Z8_ARAVE|nr:hypothetical protein AVEN_123713-1 [Araneus ventricosus]
MSIAVFFLDLVALKMDIHNENAPRNFGRVAPKSVVNAKNRRGEVEKLGFSSLFHIHLECWAIKCDHGVREQGSLTKKVPQNFCGNPFWKEG